MLALLKSESLLSTLAFALLLSTARAESSTELQKQSQLDCYASGWIRAPDLYPGLSTSADARLYLNGTECDQISRWEVGLRFKERSILRFAASNVTLPQRPEWNYTQSEKDDADVQGPAILPGNGHMRYGSRTLDDSNYDKLMRDYESKLRDANLWVVRAVERSVFDSRVELALHGSDEDTVTVDDHDFYAVRQFHVHVPFTNFPPQLRNSMMYESLYGDLDVSTSEFMFEYYYLLTTNDGAEIDVIAGQSGFLPKWTGGSVSTEKIKQDTILAQPSGRPREVPPHLQDPSWPPACDSGADANFTVSLSIPNDAQFESGATQKIEVQVDRVGNTTEYPSRIKLSIVTCTTDSWALGYAVDDLQREAADSCWTKGYLGRRFYSSGPDRANTLLMQEESMERLCGPEHRVDDDDDSYEFWGILPNSYRRSSIALVTDSWTTPIEVDLTIHRNNTPSFNATFVSYRNMIKVDLETQYTCDEPSSATANELTKSDAWGPRPCASRTRRSRRRHVGLVPIKILAGGDQASQGVKIYTDPLAEAIVLNTQSTFSGQYPLVNSTWQTDFADWDLVQRKYSVWERGSSPRSSDRRIDHGGASDLVSDAWARKKCPEYWASQRGEEIAIAGPEGQKLFGV